VGVLENDPSIALRSTQDEGRGGEDRDISPSGEYAENQI